MIYKARLKLWKDNDWKWHVFELSLADVLNIGKDFSLSDAACPVLRKHGRRFSLSFASETESKLPEKKREYCICAVDIGVSNAAVCSIIRSDGTVTGRKFISFIVMEHLNPGGKAKGSKKERLHLWRKRDVIKRTEALAHKRVMRFSTVYAPGTSRYAFDGSGAVTRDKDNISLCTFTTGKRYNADLSASYNIGGRYLIRELLKSCPETEASEAKAKVPGLSARATCTLSTYISLLAVMAAA